MRLGSALEFVPRLAEPLKHPLESLYLGYRSVVDTARLAAYGRQHSRKPRRVFGVIPRIPLPCYTLWGVAQALGLKLVALPAERTMLFVDLTVVPKGAYAGSEKWINGRCRDITKTTVARAFEEVAGYPLAVDPERYQGLIVEKSEMNASHDGRIVCGPLTKRNARCVYLRLIDNVTSDGHSVEDLRAVVVGMRIPLVFRKRRTLARRFESSSAMTELITPEDVFSVQERDMFVAFSRAIGLDFGELDVLRDRGDGRAYVVDANKTTVSPPLTLDYATRLRALSIIGEAFEREFLS